MGVGKEPRLPLGAAANFHVLTDGTSCGDVFIRVDRGDQRVWPEKFLVGLSDDSRADHRREAIDEPSRAGVLDGPRCCYDVELATTDLPARLVLNCAC
jgi:hypothetical protein